MRTYDFSPLFRSTVGFDRVSRLVDAAMQQTDDVGYPPYNIEKLSDDATGSPWPWPGSVTRISRSSPRRTC